MNSLHDCQQLAQKYVDWLGQDIKSDSIGGVCTLTVPFLDRHRDFLQIYVTTTPEGQIISDDGYTIRDLRISGLDIETPRRREALSQIIRTFDIHQNGDEISVIASDNDFPQRQHELIQAMLAIGDLIHLAQPTVVSVFKEDVEQYLRAHEIQFTVDVKLTGESGLSHPFDFVIGAGDRSPEQYMRAINTPSRDTIVEFMFSWRDLQSVRPKGAEAYAILNDQNRPVSRSLLDALDSYRIGVIPWSDIDARIKVFQSHN